MFRKKHIAGIILFTVLAGNVLAVEFSGQVKITEKGRAAAAKEYQDAVIYFIPEMGINDVVPLTGVEVRMEKKVFTPRVIPVTSGTNISFPNFDSILHNAFSTTNRNNFDLGLYSGGETDTHTFNSEGLVRVYCNVHHSMVSYILVLNTPYFTKLSPDGIFNFQDLPSEAGTLYLWHPRAKVIKQELDFSQGIPRNTNYELDLKKRRIPKHKNKIGDSYRKKRGLGY